MAQAKVQFPTTPPYPGLTLVNNLNAAFAALGSGFAGPTDPITFGGVAAYFIWIDTSSSPALVKRRNAGNTAWIDVGKAFVDTSVAGGVAFENTASGLAATDVQEALDEIAGMLASLAADEVSYDNAASGLTATDVQGAIDEVAATAGGALQSDDVSVTPTADLVPRARSDGTLDPRWLGFGPDAAREMLLREATLRANFADNEYWLYEGLSGLARKSFSDLFTFARASDATGLTATGVLATASTNEHRLVGNREGLLLEESRTNLLLNSDAPATQSVTVTNATVYTLSVYGSGSASITTGGSGAATEGSPLTFTSVGTTVEVTVSGTLDRFQLEAGSVATSFILTTGSQVTRAVDAVSRTLGSEFNPSCGTVFADFELMTVSGNLSVLYLGFPDNQSYRMNGLLVRLGGLMFAYRAIGANGYESPALATAEVGRRYRAAFSFDREKRTYACALDRQTSFGSIAEGAVGDELNTLFLSGRNAHIGSFSPGRNGAAYHNVQYIPRVLTETELITLTTPEAA